MPLLVISLSASTICTMLIATTYNLVDTYFVSGLGKSQVGAVGVMFSAMALIQAVGYTFGMGAGSLISRFLGKKDKNNAGTDTDMCIYGINFLWYDNGRIGTDIYKTADKTFGSNSDDRTVCTCLRKIYFDRNACYVWGVCPQ